MYLYTTYLLDIFIVIKEVLKLIEINMCTTGYQVKLFFYITIKEYTEWGNGSM